MGSCLDLYAEAVLVDPHARQSAESWSGSRRSGCGGSHDTVTGCILLLYVESWDIVERGLSDVNDAGIMKDRLWAYTVLTTRGVEKLCGRHAAILVAAVAVQLVKRGA